MDTEMGELSHLPWLYTQLVTELDLSKRESRCPTYLPLPWWETSHLLNIWWQCPSSLASYGPCSSVLKVGVPDGTRCSDVVKGKRTGEEKQLVQRASHTNHSSVDVIHLPTEVEPLVFADTTQGIVGRRDHRWGSSSQKGKQKTNNSSKMWYRYVCIAAWIECGESNDGEVKGKRALQAGGTAQAKHSVVSSHSGRGLKQCLDVKTLGGKTAKHTYQYDCIDREDICFPRHPWPGPSFLDPHTVSIVNSLSVHFNKFVLHSHKGNCFMAFENTINGQRTQASSHKKEFG